MDGLLKMMVPSVHAFSMVGERHIDIGKASLWYLDIHQELVFLILHDTLTIPFALIVEPLHHVRSPTG